MNLHKHSLVKSLLAAVVIALAGVAGTASAADDNPTLKALTVPSFIPFEIPEDDGTVSGFDMDILAEVAKRAGFDYTLKTMTFSGIIPALQTKSADVAISGITITKVRDKVVDFTVPYYQSGLRIMVPVDDDTTKTLDDLKGKVISTKIGSTSYDFLTDYFGDSATIKTFPDSANMYMAVLIGAADASVYDLPNASYFAKTKGEGKVKMVGPLYEAQPYGLAFVDGSKWVEPASKALKSMIEDGTYDKIYKKYFGQNPPEGWFEKASSEVTW